MDHQFAQYVSYYQAKYSLKLLNIFEVKNQTLIGKEIETIISDGKFANDEIVNKLIENFISDPKKKK